MNGLLRFVGFCVAAIIGGCIVWIAGSYEVIKLPNAQPVVSLAVLELTYSDFITIMLTCVTIVLAAVGIGVGVIAAYTFRNLKRDAERKVDTAVTRRLDAMGDEMNERIARLAYSVGHKLNNDDNLNEEMEDR